MVNTQYSAKDADKLMEAFHELGNELLSKLLSYYAAPEDRKTLRTWGIKDAASMTGRSEQYIRKLENNDDFVPPQRDKNGKRIYTLERINEIRDYFGTRYKRPEGSSAITLAISNFKGGVAKSTTCLHFAQKSALEGLRILCVDLDPQATLTLGFGYVPDIHLNANDTINNVLCPIIDDKTNRENAIKEESNIKKYIRKTYFDGISLIPGNLALADMELILANPDFQQDITPILGMPHERLKKALKTVQDDYDVIVIDCGPNLGVLTINAVTAANALLVPIPPMMSDFGSYVTFTGTLSALFNKIKKNFDFFRIVLTKHPDSKEARAIEKMMRDKFGSYILSKSILSSVEIEKASAQFGSIYELEKTSGETYRRAANSLDGVFNEIINAFKAIWSAQNLDSQTNSVHLENLGAK